MPISISCFVGLYMVVKDGTTCPAGLTAALTLKITPSAVAVWALTCKVEAESASALKLVLWCRRCHSCTCSRATTPIRCNKRGRVHLLHSICLGVCQSCSCAGLRNTHHVQNSSMSCRPGVQLCARTRCKYCVWCVGVGCMHARNWSLLYAMCIPTQLRYT